MTRRSFWAAYALDAVARLASAAQRRPQASISIDPNRPYLDIVFDKIGKRLPTFHGESIEGLWLRLRNNSVLPVVADRAAREDPNGGMLLAHNVVRNPLPADGQVRMVAQADPLKAPTVKLTLTMPDGYGSGHLGETVVLVPGKELIFSVPLTHVTRDWHVQVRLFLDDPSRNAYGSQPVVLVEFGWAGLSARAQRESDRLLHPQERPQSGGPK